MRPGPIRRGTCAVRSRWPEASSIRRLPTSIGGWRSRPTTAGCPDFVKEYVAWGAGLRASQYIVLGAKSKAALSGRNTVTCEDVKAVLTPVLRHRIGMNFRAEVDKVTVEDLIKRLQEAVPAPN